MWVHESGVPRGDASGKRLHDYLRNRHGDVPQPEPRRLLPTGLCYPGVAATGGDLPLEHSLTCVQLPSQPKERLHCCRQEV
jgi:hypothetical protein